MAMLDVRLLCDTEFVVGTDSVATFFCSLLRATSQTFSTPPPFCVGGLTCVALLQKNKGLSKQSTNRVIKMSQSINHSLLSVHLTPPRLFVPLWASSITLFSCLLVSVELGAV